MTWLFTDVSFAGLLLAALIPVAALAPLRWAVLAWLVMTHLDATGSGPASNVQVGWLNGLKAVALPCWLLVRLRAVPGSLAASFGGRAWLLLAGYAALSAAWSEFPLAGVKLAAGMAGILVAAAVLEKAVRAGALKERSVWQFLAASVALAVFQTALFPDGSFGFAGRGMPQRFTSFIGAQQYAALAAALVSWVLWIPELRSGWRTFWVLLLFAALAANGSRTWSAGALLVLASHGLFRERNRAGFMRLAAAVLVLFSLPAVRHGLAARRPGPANRLAATASAVLTGEDRAGGMGLGTARFRLRMYGGVAEALRNSSAPQWVLGHGAASGGRLGLRLFPYAYRPESLDANRVIHNEWLRVTYEFGAVGSALWLAVLGAVGRLAWRRRQERAAAALLAYLPAWLLGLSAENVIDGAGNAVTTGFLLLLAGALAAPGPAEGKGA